MNWLRYAESRETDRRREEDRVINALLGAGILGIYLLWMAVCRG